MEKRCLSCARVYETECQAYVLDDAMNMEKRDFQWPWYADNSMIRRRFVQCHACFRDNAPLPDQWYRMNDICRDMSDWNRREMF